MFRSAALTLGAILVLGASSVQAQDLWDLPGAGLLPSFVGVLPTLPQNWSDLPATFKMSEGVGYNSNVSNLSSVNNLARAPTIGAFESISNFSLSTRGFWQGQQFFADGSLGLNRYLNQTFLNTTSHALDAGVNWLLTTRCSGQLIASEQVSPSEPGQQVGFSTVNNIVNTATTKSYNETARCGISGEYSAIFNSGTSSTSNSAPLDALNNSNDVFVSAGMSYTAPNTDSLQLLASITGSNFGSRQLLGTLANVNGLAQKITDDKINLSFTKQFNPNLSMIASIGVVGIRDSFFALALPKGWLPQYTFSLSWAITPKFAFVGSVARVATPPTSVIANLQISESASIGFTYALTPKVTFATSASVSRDAGAFSSTTTTSVLGVSQSSTQYAARADLSYSMTPFLGATLSLQALRSVQAGGFVIPTDIALLTVSYAPH
jgi:hypothetical protein